LHGMQEVIGSNPLSSTTLSYKPLRSAQWLFLLQPGALTYHQNWYKIKWV
jgi:hypothetical protein